MTSTQGAGVNDFGVGSVRRTILRMAVPITLAQLVNILYNIVDRMYIGPYGWARGHWP